MAEHKLVIPQTVQVTYAGLNAGTGWRVVTHAVIPDGTPVNVALADAIFTSVGGLWTAQLAPQCPATTTFNFAELRDLRGPNLPLVQSTGAARPGTAVGSEALPRNIAVCFTVRTSRAGKQYRGRMYWTGFGEAANSATANIVAAAKTACDNFASGFISAANVSGLQFGVSHRPTAFDEITGLPISPGLGFTTPAVSVVCRDSRWDSQRRRNP